MVLPLVAHSGHVRMVPLFLWKASEMEKTPETHLGFQLSSINVPLPLEAVKGLELLLDDHQPLLHLQQVVVETLVALDVFLALSPLQLRTRKKDAKEKRKKVKENKRVIEKKSAVCQKN